MLQCSLNICVYKVKKIVKVFHYIEDTFCATLICTAETLRSVFSILTTDVLASCDGLHVTTSSIHKLKYYP